MAVKRSGSMASDQPSRPIRPRPNSYIDAPFLWISWVCEWIAYLAGNIAVFQVLEYAGKLTILIALITWVVEFPERKNAAIRAAWSIVNEKGGGRKDNLEYLVNRQVDLKGLSAAGGYFANISLERSDLRWSDLEDANFEGSDLDGANLEGSRLSGEYLE
jgi:hypothetical protein